MPLLQGRWLSCRHYLPRRSSISRTRTAVLSPLIRGLRAPRPRRTARSDRTFISEAPLPATTSRKLREWSASTFIRCGCSEVRITYDIAAAQERGTVGAR
jgi:hypothetical protein